MKRNLQVATLLAASLAAPAARAFVPDFASAKTVLDRQSGGAREITGHVDVTTDAGVNFDAVVERIESARGYSVDGTASVVAKPGVTVSVPFRLSIPTDGRYHVSIPVDFFGDRGRLAEKVNATVDLDVRGGTYTAARYEDLFMRPIGEWKTDLGASMEVHRAGPVPYGWQFADDFPEDRWEMEELEVPTDEEVKNIGPDTGEVESPTLPLPPPGKLVVNPAAVEENKLFEVANVIARAAAALGTSPQKVMDAKYPGGMTAEGNFNYTGLDGLMHPAWGWRVYAYQVIGNTYVTLAKSNVKKSSYWKLDIPFAAPGFPIVISYEPRNIYYYMTNNNSQYYNFTDGVQYMPVSGMTINEFTQVAYLGDSDIVGLGEIHRDGMALWDKFKTRGEGIDPVRNDPILIHFPNTNYDCDPPKNKIWSCAGGNEIWVIPAHADGNVVQHELGHQLMLKFWGGSPPTAGGSHNRLNCYKTGLALSEGFANFVMVWANVARGSDPTAAGYMDLEHPENDGACTTKNKNETWVAAAFWDLLDLVNTMVPRETRVRT